MNYDDVVIPLRALSSSYDRVSGIGILFPRHLDNAAKGMYLVVVSGRAFVALFLCNG